MLIYFDEPDSAQVLLSDALLEKPGTNSLTRKKTKNISNQIKIWG